MNLENKFYNFLTKELPFYLDSGKTLSRVAKDLAEIAEGNIKHLNADEVEHIIGSINTNQEKVQAICNLAIDIDRDKIIEVLDSRFKTQLRMYLIELYSVTGKLTEKQENDIKDYMKKSADEIIRVIRKD